MGFARKCFNLLGFLVLALAVVIGLIMSAELPMGVLFKSLVVPQREIDRWKGKLTPPVPNSMEKQPRPEKELSFTLPSGHKMLGTGIGMCCRPSAYDDESVVNTVLWYLLQGGRLIDTALLYLNHIPIGKALKLAESRGIPREEVFVTTKIWPGQFGYASTKYWIGRALEDLGVQYVDLFLLHAPIDVRGLMLGEESAFEGHDDCNSMVTCWEGTWRALGEARKAGQVRDIGVSNFNEKQLEELRALPVVAEHPIAVNQVAYNPWVPQWQKDVVAYCHKHGIAVTGYNTLGGYYSKDSVVTRNTLQDIAKNHNTSVYLVLSRWSLQKNVAIIPGTGNPKHMASNIGVYSFTLADEEMARIDAFTPDDPEAPLFFALQDPTT